MLEYLALGQILDVLGPRLAGILGIESDPLVFVVEVYIRHEPPATTGSGEVPPGPHDSIGSGVRDGPHKPVDDPGGHVHLERVGVSHRDFFKLDGLDVSFDFDGRKMHGRTGVRVREDDLVGRLGD